jgi:hypothetical protein
MKHRHLMLFAAVTLFLASRSFAQRSHPGGPPPGRGPGGASASGMNGPNKNAGMSHTDMSHATPSDVLSHNTAIAGKIKSLTGQDAQTACSGFKNLGQCVAAAHVAKNLNITGGFDALKAKITGDNATSLGKAIEQLAPNANAKSETKKANKQASDEMKETSS